ncbi:MAG: hypothetical protein AAFZ07_03030 [Actinomycetota bacterium]
MQHRIYLETDLNRVFTSSLGSIAAAELDVVLTHRLGAPGTDITFVEEGRSSYLRFGYDGDRSALAAELGRLCATAAAFVEHSPTSLEPLPVDDRLSFGTDLVTTQRYKGKTNERLTRLLLNAAIAVRGSEPGADWSLLDPMCGRGTTLNWALLHGGRATGLDIDRRSLDDYATFLEQWAKGHRLPHKMQRYKKTNSESRHFDFTVAVDRPGLAAKAAPDVRTFHAPADDESLRVGRHSMLVADLPYGIQHRARHGGRAPTSVGELVERVSVRWPEQLDRDATVALSWNVRSLAREQLVETIVAAGLEPVPTLDFAHRVDRTITRDVVVARTA